LDGYIFPFPYGCFENKMYQLFNQDINFKMFNTYVLKL